MNAKERAAVMATAGQVLLAQTIRELRTSGVLPAEAIENIFRRTDNILSATFPTDVHSDLLTRLRALVHSENDWR